MVLKKPRAAFEARACLKCSTLNVARQASCSALTAPQKNLDMAYDVLGNITSKSGIGGYAYPTSGSASVRPHAVTAAGSTNYVYDNNGNMMTRGGSNITWYSYNLPKKIDNGSNSAEFFYGAARSRFKQIAITAAGGSLPAGTQTTLYIAGLYEQVTKPSGVIEHKHYIVAGGEAVAIRTLRSNSADDTRYLHKDHLGSVDVITSETGSVVQRLSYDAFGQRRNAAAWSGALSISDWTSIAAITHRGFTFHEELDNVDLIHMNGRVYDANIGRFISADPLIQAPLMSQSFNRYSYVINNPLSLVDPSGYSWFSKTFKKITRHVNAVVRFHFMPTPRNFFETIKSIPGQDKIDRYVMTHEWAYKVGYAAAVVSSWWIGGYGGAVYQSYYTYVATGSATEAVKVGVRAAAIQFATNYLLTGSGFNMPAPTSPGPIILYADGGAGAAGGAGLFNMFMKAYYGAPNAPDYSAVGGTVLAGAALPVAGRTAARNPYVLGGAVVIGGSLYAVLNFSQTAGFLRRPDYMSGPEYVPPAGPLDDVGASTPGDPNQFDPNKQPPLQVIHASSQIRNSSSYRYWSQQSTDSILRSLRPGQHEALRVAPDGRIFNGNTRITVLQGRGIDVNALPRELYVPLDPGL